MQTIHTFGDNVRDLEGTISPLMGGGASLTTEYLTLPLTMGIRVIDKKTGTTYYGKVQTADDRIASINSTGVRIPVDDKYNLDGSLTPLEENQVDAWKAQNGIASFLDVQLVMTAGGGGAHNSSVGEQVYLNGQRDLPLQARLVVPFGSQAIADNLPKGLIYHPLFGITEGSVAANLNISLEYGKKLTFRSKPSAVGTYANLGAVTSGDIVIVDSVKDPKYITAVLSLLGEKVQFYLAATDSMVKALGRQAVYDLALRTDLLVANEGEFDMIMGRDTKTDQAFVDTLAKLQDDQHNQTGKRGRILVTHGELGSTLYEIDQRAYFQPVALSPIKSPHTTPTRIVNTNGCGDAYFAVAVISQAVGLPVKPTLSNANAAGHLCAFEKAASGDWMATDESIRKFRDIFGDPPIMFYSMTHKEFRPM